MLATIMKWLGSGVLQLFGNSILQPILSHLDQKNGAARDMAIAQTNAGRDVDLANVQLEIQANSLRAQLTPDYKWVVYALMAPVVLHFGAVLLDSLPFGFGIGHVTGAWKVPAPPAPYDDYEGKMILSFFLLHPTTALVKAAASRIAR